MRILITGVSGYAGYYAAIRLAARRPRRYRSRAQSRSAAAQRAAHARGQTGGGRRVATRNVPRATREQPWLSSTRCSTNGRRRRPIARCSPRSPRCRSTPGVRRRFIYTTGCSIFGKLADPRHGRDDRTESETLPRLPPRDGKGSAGAGKTSASSCCAPASCTATTASIAKPSTGSRWATPARASIAATARSAGRGSTSRILPTRSSCATEADRAIDGELFYLADDRQPLCVDVMRGCVAVAGYRGEISVRRAARRQQHQHLVRSERTDLVGKSAPRPRLESRAVPALCKRSPAAFACVESRRSRSRRAVSGRSNAASSGRRAQRFAQARPSARTPDRSPASGRRRRGRIRRARRARR